MLSLFANPFAMIAGALLISSPIIIHLINRMRYKRIRWAAMEFLLKSQKRSRRKLIIEQMILLALRILMVLLIGLLLARFVGCEKGGTEGHPTFHIILIDDTLSTSDTIRAEDGQVRDVYAEGKRLAADQIAATAAQATSPQYVRVFRLSDLENPYPHPTAPASRLNPMEVDAIRSHLVGYRPSLRHVDLVDGLKAVKAEFEKEKNMDPMLHVVGDLRAIDWSDRNKEGLSQAFEELKTA